MKIKWRNVRVFEIGKIGAKLNMEKTKNNKL